MTLNSPVYQYSFTRKRIGEPLGSVRVPEDLHLLGQKLIGDRETESFLVTILDTKNNLIGFEELYRGHLSGASVRVGEVFRGAVRLNAAAIAVIHNHPSGDPSPSNEDLHLTGELAAAGKLLDIELLDSLVVTGSRYVSLRALGALGPTTTGASA